MPGEPADGKGDARGWAGAKHVTYLHRSEPVCHALEAVRPRNWIAWVALATGCGKGPAAPAKGPPVAVAPPEVAAPAAPAPTAAVATAAAPPVERAPRGSVRVGNLEGAPHLARFFDTLSALEEGTGHGDVRILQYGDSHTASDTATSVVRRLLQARFGDGGRGFVQLGMPWRTYTQDGVRGGMTKDFEPLRQHVEAGRAVGDGAYGLLGVALGADRRGARAWTRVMPASSQVEIDYWQQPHGGSAEVLIDGAPVGRIETRAAQPASGFAAYDVREGPHEVELRAVGDGELRVFGLVLDRAKAGVVVDALGINGAQTTLPLRWTEEHFAEQLRHRAPDLVVLAYGTNEALDPKLDLGEYQRVLVDLLGRVARAVPTASCLLLGPPDLARRKPPEHPEWATWPPVLDVIAVQQRVAEAAGCAFYNQLDAMGGPGSMATWAAEAEPRAQSDRVHLTRTGYARVATSFTTDLLRAYDEWRAASGGVAKVADIRPASATGIAPPPRTR